MGKLAQQLSGQSDVKVFAKGGKVGFEKTKKDREYKKYGREGSRSEEEFDQSEMKRGGKVGMKKGGKCK